MQRLNDILRINGMLKKEFNFRLLWYNMEMGETFFVFIESI